MFNLIVSTLVLALPGQADQSSPNCALMCRANPTGWKEKCSWRGACDGCSECNEKQVHHQQFYAGYNPQGREEPNEDNIKKPETAREVVEIVKKAKEEGRTVSVGGGENTAWWDAGYYAISMKKMKKVLKVDKRSLTMTVQTGLTAGEIQKAANEHGMMAAIGQASQVGVGFLLQGGFGHQTRMMGLGSDRVVGAEVVTANGDHVCVGDQPVSDSASDKCSRLSETDDADLLYAIRGAGPNFAVVLSLTVSMVPLNLCDCNFQEFGIPVSDPPAASAQIFQPYAQYARNAPRNLNVDGIIFYNPFHYKWVLGVYNFFFTPEGEPRKAPPPLKIPGHEPVRPPQVFSRMQPYQLPEIEPSSKITPAELGIDFDKGPTWIGLGLYVDTAQNLDNVWEVLAAAIGQCPNSFCYVLLQHAGGAISDVPINATAFGASRGIEWMVYIVGVGYTRDTDPSDSSYADNVDNWVRVSFRKILAQASGTYATDLSPQDFEFIPYAYGMNMGKICQLKVKSDPEGMFTAGSVPLAYWCNYQYGGLMHTSTPGGKVNGIIQKSAMSLGLQSQLETPQGIWPDANVLLMGILTTITVVSSTVSVVALRNVRAALGRLQPTETQELPILGGSA